jgi:SAM-dependent methyltransferase/uncharacterized protein YbaR (Trm112 family)
MLEANEFDKMICMEGALRCSCGLSYPIYNGIPRLIVPGELRPGRPDVDDAQQEDRRAGCKDGSGDNKAQIQSAFGYKWKRQKWWGLEGETAAVFKEWLFEKYGWRGNEEYNAFMSGKETCLDAGCGLGRETVRMARANDGALCIGIDLSASVDEAAEYARREGLKNVFFIQADLMAPPIKSGTIDFIISEGVLHHTPDTKKAFISLVPLLSKSGEIGVYVYRLKAPLREYADDYVRQRVSALPPDEAWVEMESLTKVGKILADVNAVIDIPEDVDALGIKAGKYDLQRFIYYNMFKCYWNDRMSFQENVHVNYDWYYPKYAWRHTEEEVAGWVQDEGLKIIHEYCEESGITIRAKR